MRKPEVKWGFPTVIDGAENRKFLYPNNGAVELAIEMLKTIVT